MCLRFFLCLGVVAVFFVPSGAFCHDLLKNYTPPPMFDEASAVIQDAQTSPPIPLDRPAQFKASRSYALKLLNVATQDQKPPDDLRVQSMSAADVLRSLE